MNSVKVFAAKELLDLRRNRVVWILAACLSIAVLVSVVVASLAYRTQVTDYRAYVDALAASGSAVVPAAPQLYPLTLLRGAIEYLEIIGALFAVVVGYATIAREKSRGTMLLILTRAGGAKVFIAGKLVGLGVFWALLSIGLILVSALSLALVGSAGLGASAWGRLGIAAVAAWLYLMFWTALAAGVTAFLKRPSTALVLMLGVWLLVVLVIPQIGDTMDPDNQVPGGLFAALAIQKSDEVAVLAHFSTYESIRNALEASSIEKLYERITFAFLGIKDKYNQQPAALIWPAMQRYTWTVLVLVAGSFAFALTAATRTRLQR
jgi:ABC-2 type transport system permease protein